MNDEPKSVEGNRREEEPSTSSIPVAPALDAELRAEQVPVVRPPIDLRTLRISALSVLLGVVSAFVALALMHLINLVTSVSFFGTLSLESRAPADAVSHLGAWVILIPVVGGLVVGVMARFGSAAIRGHGIPEAMEQILTNRSRIPGRVSILKPLSSAIAIGTGGPFGAEGPIIATGGAIGSLIGQFTACSPAERKTLLAAGAAGGMAATFGSPVSAVLLAIELLLFEFRPRSIIPVALSASIATGMRFAFEGLQPAFSMPDIGPASLPALVFYMALGAAMGVLASGVTWVVYAIEDLFDRLPIHWMWWPALGAVAVGVVGLLAPDTLGVGYYNISAILSNTLTLKAVAFLCVMKFVSWSIALGSGTSGGTLAPLFTIGGAVGLLVAGVSAALLPATVGIDPHVAALVGMAALFAGASRALLASAIFAFEATLQPLALMPLLAGCAAAYLTSSLVMRNTIMTEKIARRGVRTPSDYATDPLEHVTVRDIASTPVVTLKNTQTVAEVQAWMNARVPGSAHQGYPVVDERGALLGVITRRDVFSAHRKEDSLMRLIKQMPRYVFDDCTARQAADHMLNHDIGRLPVVPRTGKPCIIGIVTRSDILSCYRGRISDTAREAPTKRLPRFARWR